MFDIIFTEQFDKSFSKIKDNVSKKQIWKKIQELEERAPMGKKLKGNPYWSLRVSRFRVIYLLEGNQITVADVIERKRGYRGY
jgi:mRNA-degrading endonuclease RelE of RelBE toxin-antitoxin system